MTGALILALVLLAMLLAIVVLVQSRGTALIAWAVLALGVALALPVLVAL
jgi:hypothetical protein